MNHTIDTSGPRGPSAKAGSRAYREARRHSVRVRFFRRAIPVGALVTIASVAYIAIADPFGRMAGVTLGPVSLSGTKITMEHPRLTGYRKDQRPYEVTASAALQDIRKPNVLELTQMKAKLSIDDVGGQAYLDAKFGIFDTQKEQLELREDVFVRTDDAQEAVLKSAFIDFKAGTVVSKEPVTVKMRNATVNADALNMSDNGGVITFIGNVKTVLQSVDPGPEVAQRAAPSSAPSAKEPARTSQAETLSLRQ